MNTQTRVTFQVIKNYRKTPIKIRKHRKAAQNIPLRAMETRLTKIRRQRIKRAQQKMREIQRIQVIQFIPTHDPLEEFQGEIKPDNDERDSNQMVAISDNDQQSRQQSYFDLTQSKFLNPNIIDQL